MRIQALRALALVAGLVARIRRAGPPRPVSTAERLAALTLDGHELGAPVEIAWNAHQVPSIVARSEHDLAVALGAVHAHLRLAQMEAMRRLATGRVAEVAGPAAIELDRALRLFGFDAAVPGIRDALPEATRRWADGFLAGVNRQIGSAALPYELRLLGIRPEPWTIEDLLTVSRLAASDVSWLVFARLLRGRAGLAPAAWDRLWPLLQTGDTLPFPERAEEAAIGLVRGSNSAAVAASGSRRGAGLIASDPHLGIALPPLWLIAGLHAPGLDVVGLMIPGLPIVALGRNRHIAWGGTNLHAASSELVDVADEAIAERQERIAVRGRPAQTVTLRSTRFGPVISDGMLLRAPTPLALRWVGHRPSDELSAMLGAMRAENLEGFRAALRPFAIPAQTMVATEAGPTGRAGRVIAAHLPRRAGEPQAGLVARPDAVWSLDDLVHGQDFPVPDEAIVASANDRPDGTPVPVGFFFSPPDRMRRLRSVLERATPVGVEDMRRLQLDVQSPGALALRDRLIARLPDSGVRRALAGWDGEYGVGSQGALAFEVLLGSLARQLIPAPELAVLAGIWSGRALMRQRIAAAPLAALERATRDAARALRRYRNWGGVHRLGLRHPLAALPLVGRWFARPAPPIAGSNETVAVTGHGLVTGRHRVTFGACARHVSDLADPDANWFVLLGGQDGWLGSANAADQVAMWQHGEAIQVPLRPEATADWPYRTVLTP